jgi:hypothetical protein
MMSKELTEDVAANPITHGIAKQQVEQYFIAGIASGKRAYIKTLHDSWPATKEISIYYIISRWDYLAIRRFLK